MKKQHKMEQLLKYKTVLKKIANIFHDAGQYKAAQHFLEDVGITCSIGTIAKFYKQYAPGYYGIHRGYGHGKNVKVNRVDTT